MGIDFSISINSMYGPKYVYRCTMSYDRNYIIYANELKTSTGANSLQDLFLFRGKNCLSVLCERTTLDPIKSVF